MSDIREGLNRFLNESIRNNLVETGCAIPAKITKFDKEKNTVNVTHSIKKWQIEKEGELTYLDVVEIFDVPVYAMRTHEYAETMPIRVDDLCLLVHCDRSTEEWIDGKEPAEPKSNRIHHIDDVVALIGCYPRTKAIEDWDQNWAEWRSIVEGSDVRFRINSDLGCQAVASRETEEGGGDTDVWSWWKPGEYFNSFAGRQNIIATVGEGVEINAPDEEGFHVITSPDVTFEMIPDDYIQAISGNQKMTMTLGLGVLINAPDSEGFEVVTSPDVTFEMIPGEYIEGIAGNQSFLIQNGIGAFIDSDENNITLFEDGFEVTSNELELMVTLSHMCQIQKYETDRLEDLRLNTIEAMDVDDTYPLLEMGAEYGEPEFPQDDDFDEFIEEILGPPPPEPPPNYEPLGKPYHEIISDLETQICENLLTIKGTA